LIDVFVPTWNSERTIKRCLECINASIPGAIIKIIDRNSSDKTYDIAKNNAIFYISDLNIGEARKVMCDNARGPWFVMIDSDTYVSKKWFKVISSQKEALERVDNKVGAIQGENIPMHASYRNYMLSHKTKRVYPLKNPSRLLTCNLLIKKEAVFGFKCEAPIYEDYLLGFHIRKRGFNSYVVPAYADHDTGDIENLKLHAKWAGSGMRKYGEVPLWKLLGGLFLSLFGKNKKISSLLYYYWIIGFLDYEKYLELKR